MNLLLAHYQHFSDIIPGEEEFDRREIAEQRLDMSVIEHALQAEAVCHRSVNRSRGSTPRLAAHDHTLHFERVFIEDVKAIAGRIRPRILGMEKSQHHAARLEHRP